MKKFISSCIDFLKEHLKYFILTAIFACIVFIAFGIMVKNIDCNDIVIIVSAIISIFGGALASVVVAWLIDIANQRRDYLHNKKVLNCVLTEYDLTIKQQMERILTVCVENQDADANKSYNIHEIHSMLTQIDESNPVFVNLSIDFSKAIDKMDLLTILYLDSTYVGVGLYEMFSILKGCSAIMKALLEMDDSQCSIKILFTHLISTCATIDDIRETNNSYTLSKKL